MKYLDLPQAVAMVAEKSQVKMDQKNDGNWEYPLAVAKKLGWTERIAIGDRSNAGQSGSKGSR
jgi:hypothetical protein